MINTENKSDNPIQLKDLSGIGLSQEKINSIRFVSYKNNWTYTEAKKTLEDNSWNCVTVIDSCRKKNIIALIMRQTNYTLEETKSKVEEYNYNYEIIIKEYLGININNKNKEDTNEQNTTTNQRIFNEMRKFMDNATDQYKKRKELNQKKKIAHQILENISK